jgi:hypothetical protein
MNTNIILLLLCICIAIQQLQIQALRKHISILQHNNEVLRKGINNLSGGTYEKNKE